MKVKNYFADIVNVIAITKAKFIIKNERNFESLSLNLNVKIKVIDDIYIVNTDIKNIIWDCNIKVKSYLLNIMEVYHINLWKSNLFIGKIFFI